MRNVFEKSSRANSGQRTPSHQVEKSEAHAHLRAKQRKAANNESVSRRRSQTALHVEQTAQLQAISTGVKRR